MKKIFTFFFISFLLRVDAQSIDDILKVSRQDYEGTARFAAMGGAFGALGGDISSIGINPAGVAVFRKSHVSFTSSLNHIYNNADFAGIKTDDSRLRAGISNLGVVAMLGHFENIQFNFGIEYTKKTNFNRRTSAVSAYGKESIIDYFSDKANSDKNFFAPENLNADNAFDIYNPLDWDVAMAYGTYLIDWDENDYYGVIAPDDKVRQQTDILFKGSSGEMVFDAGINIDEKFYFGILLGMTTLKYEKTVTYNEYAHENNVSDFNRLIYNTDLKIGGLGLNYKFGIIYKPFQPLRLGLSFHSPDYFLTSAKDTYDDESEIDLSMDNLYSASLETHYKTNSGIKTFNDGSGDEYYLFFDRIKTPFKATGSFAYIFGKVGLISVDCEYVDYSRIKLKGDEPKSLFNSNIKEYFKNTVNLRFGTEFWIRNIALRAGYGYTQSPDKDYDISRKTYSAGLGYKFKNLNVDLAYIQTNTTDYYTHYTGARTITENLKNRRLSLTLGYTFNWRDD
jgi:hypothetical protein